ncbi:CBS domain-containing protein [Catellatospora sichuanensis]|uniref:CBS domain-containing protein n=1 Tax=Catellatospora sichuanensis TaxID=1969805 RepID=UPI0016433A9B|nr:CBS domain-containing protein [Catellatospora sichuanensis]
MPADQEVVTVTTDTKVSEALAVMARTGFDQIPVTRNKAVVGVFSYRSFASNIGVVRPQDDPRAYAVADFLEDLYFVRYGSDVADALPAIEAKGAVLIGDEDNLLAVVTAADLNSYLWHSSRQFMLLRDIELATRHLVKSACASEEELRTYIATSTQTTANSPMAAALEDLTFSELISLISHRERFGRVFNRTFGGSRELVVSLLEPVREVRNKVFHFRGEVTAEESELMMSASAWLKRRVRMVP